LPTELSAKIVITMNADGTKLMYGWWLLMNIVLGIVGAAVASAILSFFGIALGGWLGYLIAGFIGACLLIWVVRWIQGSRRTA
jgi:uncharacterized membrane protein YeaQ/YmgE (transglycosylase-associated protein family)